MDVLDRERPDPKPFGLEGDVLRTGLRCLEAAYEGPAEARAKLDGTLAAVGRLSVECDERIRLGDTMSSESSAWYWEKASELDVTDGEAA
jgi:hypothetical protein